jgi:hypothetical protein
MQVYKENSDKNSWYEKYMEATQDHTQLHVPRYFAGHKQLHNISEQYTAARYHLHVISDENNVNKIELSSSSNT